MISSLFVTSKHTPPYRYTMRIIQKSLRSLTTIQTRITKSLQRFMYWKSVKQQNLPITIKYQKMVVEIVPHFEDDYCRNSDDETSDSCNNYAAPMTSRGCFMSTRISNTGNTAQISRSPYPHGWPAVH